MNKTGLETSTTEPPFVSIVMPVRDELSYIRRSVTAVLVQDYPRDRMEVLVADGMSTDGTRRILRDLAQKDDRVRIIDNRRHTTAAGLNEAIAQARGDIVIRADGHCELAPDYVRRCVDHILNDRVDGVGGPIHTVGETYMARVIAAAMRSRFGVGGSAFRTTCGRTLLVDTIPFPAYCRDIIERAGKYDEGLFRNEDDEYNYRLRKLGAKLLLAADVRSTYYSRSTLPSLWHQYYRYGFWKVRVMQKHPRQMSWRQFVPATFIVALLASGSAGLAYASIAPVFFAVVGSYVLASLTATAMVARRHPAESALVPLAFAALHFAYGFGFLHGLVRMPWTPASPVRQISTRVEQVS